MSIQSEINRISGNVSDALDAIEAKGVTIPSGSNSDDLADLIGQITGGGGGAISVVDTLDSHGGTIREITAVDISSDTVTAAHLETGYTAHDAQGNAITGTLSPGGGGLEYEMGTWTPSEDTNSSLVAFSFSKAHTGRPFFVNITDVTSGVATDSSVLNWSFICWYDAYGSYIPVSATTNHYARIHYGYKTSSSISYASGNVTAEISIGSYVTSSGFTPQMPTSYYWRSGRTYKWIAVWAPTS